MPVSNCRSTNPILTVFPSKSKQMYSQMFHFCICFYDKLFLISFFSLCSWRLGGKNVFIFSLVSHHSLLVTSFRNWIGDSYFRRSGSIFPHSRRATVNSAAVLMSTAAQTAANFAIRWRFSYHPPHVLAHLGGNFAIFSPTPPTSSLTPRLSPSFSRNSELSFHSVLSTLHFVLAFTPSPPSPPFQRCPSAHRGTSLPRSPSPDPGCRTSRPAFARICFRVPAVAVCASA